MQFVQRALGWGVVIYALMYLLWSGLVIYGLQFGVLSLAVRILGLVIITSIAARSLRLATRADVATYSVSWALVAILLDAIFLVPLFGIALYMQWTVWVGYALVAVAPLLTFGVSDAMPLSSRAQARKMPAGL